MMILSRAALFDIATTSGIAQSVMLRFVDSDGVAKDVSGSVFRCAVRGPGAAAIACTLVDAASARLAWSPLKSGTHSYDLFMTAPDGAERPLIKGEIQAAPRVTPPGNEDVVEIGEIEIIIPATPEGEVKIIDPVADAAERAEAAKDAIDQAEGRINTAEDNAGRSAQTASNAATAAQQALAAIPHVDAGGNMTLAGGLATSAAINANGGVNVPVAPVMSSNALRYADLWLAHSISETRCDMAQTPAYSHGASSVGPWGRRINDLPAAGGRAMVGWSSSWDTQQSSRDTLIIRFSCSGALCNINILIEAVMGYSGATSVAPDYGLKSLMLLASADAIFPVQFGLRFLTLPGFGGGAWATTHVEVTTIGRNNALLAPVKTVRLPVTLYARGDYDFYLIKEVTSASNARVCLCIGAFVGDGMLSLKPGLTRISDWISTNSSNAKAMLGFGIGFATADQSAPDATQYFSGAPGSGPWMQVSTYRIPTSFNLDIR